MRSHHGQGSVKEKWQAQEPRCCSLGAETDQDFREKGKATPMTLKFKAYFAGNVATNFVAR
jgi:hypothetical protein